MALAVPSFSMAANRLDHLVIHVDDWEASHAFYLGVLGMERVENPESGGEPARRVRVSPGRPTDQRARSMVWSDGCVLPPPLNEIGRGDLAFRTTLSVDEVVKLFSTHGIEVVAGPIRCFGAGGWGTSVSCRDPSGKGIELISYHGS